MRAIDHPSVPKALDFGQDDLGPAIFFEYHDSGLPSRSGYRLDARKRRFANVRS
ncbi:MAG: hypothetical protein WD118_09625 [Phycisphaeraceae bacterium]